MRVPVIRAFVDKNTGKPYNAGYVFESGSAKRITELQELGFLLKSNAADAPAQTIPPAPPAGNPDQKPAEDADDQPAGQARPDVDGPKGQE